VIRIQVERNEPISDRILLTSPSPEVRFGLHIQNRDRIVPFSQSSYANWEKKLDSLL